jgi:hypothetical protein
MARDVNVSSPGQRPFRYDQIVENVEFLFVGVLLWLCAVSCAPPFPLGQRDVDFPCLRYHPPLIGNLGRTAPFAFVLGLPGSCTTL